MQTAQITIAAIPAVLALLIGASIALACTLGGLACWAGSMEAQDLAERAVFYVRLARIEERTERELAAFDAAIERARARRAMRRVSSRGRACYTATGEINGC